jgi:hypothetical protein
MIRSAVTFVVILLICLSLFALIGSEFSSSFQACLGLEAPNPFKAYPRCMGSFVQENNSAITALGTLVIAAFTGTLWIATNQQARLAKETFVASRRAFVIVPGFAQLWEQDQASNQYHWRFRSVLRNSGDTPTQNMRMYVECEVRNSLLPTGYPFAYRAQDMAGGTIPPRLELQGGLAPIHGAAVTPQDILDAQAARKFIYLWGVVQYNDVFPRTRRHATKYCFLITPTGNPTTFVPNTQGQPPTPGTMAFGFQYHSEGNSLN